MKILKTKRTQFTWGQLADVNTAAQQAKGRRDIPLPGKGVSLNKLNLFKRVSGDWHAGICKATPARMTRLQPEDPAFAENTLI